MGAAGSDAAIENADYRSHVGRSGQPALVGGSLAPHPVDHFAGTSRYLSRSKRSLFCSHWRGMPRCGARSPRVRKFLCWGYSEDCDCGGMCRNPHHALPTHRSPKIEIGVKSRHPQAIRCADPDRSTDCRRSAFTVFGPSARSAQHPVNLVVQGADHRSRSIRLHRPARAVSRTASRIQGKRHAGHLPLRSGMHLPSRSPGTKRGCGRRHGIVSRSLGASVPGAVSSTGERGR